MSAQTPWITAFTKLYSTLLVPSLTPLTLPSPPDLASPVKASLVHYLRDSEVHRPYCLR